MILRNNLYKRYGILLDKIKTELDITKKECHVFIKQFKGVNSIKDLSDKELHTLIQELIAYLASELGIEFYFGEDHTDKTLHELNNTHKIE